MPKLPQPILEKAREREASDASSKQGCTEYRSGWLNGVRRMDDESMMRHSIATAVTLASGGKFKPQSDTMMFDTSNQEN